MKGTGRHERPRFARTYREALARSTDAAAIPYGYTVLNVSAGGVLIRTHGPPAVGAALLFLCGATAGFALVCVLAAAVPGTPGEPSGTCPGPWQGVLSGAAAAAAFAPAAVIAHAVAGPTAFGAVALTATAIYLTVAALGSTVLQHRAHRGARPTGDARRRPAPAVTATTGERQ